MAPHAVRAGTRPGGLKAARRLRPRTCGWLNDRFGVSLQFDPIRLHELLSDPDREKADCVMRAMFQMKRIDIGDLERAAAGA